VAQPGNDNKKSGGFPLSVAAFIASPSG